MKHGRAVLELPTGLDRSPLPAEAEACRGNGALCLHRRPDSPMRRNRAGSHCHVYRRRTVVRLAAYRTGAIDRKHRGAWADLRKDEPRDEPRPKNRDERVPRLLRLRRTEPCHCHWRPSVHREHENYCKDYVGRVRRDKSICLLSQGTGGFRLARSMAHGAR